MTDPYEAAVQDIGSRYEAGGPGTESPSAPRSGLRREWHCDRAGGAGDTEKLAVLRWQVA